MHDSLIVLLSGVVSGGPTLAPALEAVRLSLHVLAAAVWVGGQITLAGLVPVARRLGEGATRTLARAFARIEWPAYAVLLLTGIWNVVAVHADSASLSWRVVLGVKIGVVVAAGVSALVHERARSTPVMAATGALTALCSLAALVLGVVLAG